MFFLNKQWAFDAELKKLEPRSSGQQNGPFDADGSFFKITEWINWRHFLQLMGVARYFLPPRVRFCRKIEMFMPNIL